MAFTNPRRRDAAAGPSEPGNVSLYAKPVSPLHKGATFHAPSSPTAAADQAFVPPSLPRSMSQMGDVVDANRRRIAMTLSDIDVALSLDKLSLSSSPKEDRPTAGLRDNSSPIPRGFLDLSDTDSASGKERQRRVICTRSRRGNSHASDSGLGPSVDSASRFSESVKLKGKKQLSATSSGTSTTAAAITHSIVSPNTDGLPGLGPKAVNRIHEHTIRPLLEKPSLKPFEPIVQDVPRRIRSKEIICMRDLEKTLLFMAPAKSETGLDYLDFCFTSIRCIQATVEYLNDREQVRPGDRPYTNGYFLDLKDQVLQYGRDLAAAKGDDSMDIDRNDEIRLHGGMAENGRPAELVRIRKDGTAVSMATGKPVDISEGPVQFKRSLSEQREDDEEIMRSMARRKKNATPEELAPKRCREPGCSKEFKRPCDLTKHEKTHSRPWKCPFGTCRYHDYGWPTQKEMDRHVNDKHSDAPAMYECEFKPCPYKSKRESNCKQHMEKAHGWTYVRTKTNGGKKASVSVSASAPSNKGDSPSAKETPPLANASTPSDSYSVVTPRDNNSSAAADGSGAGAQNAASSDFPLYQPDAEWLVSYGLPSEHMEGMDLGMEQPSPLSAASYEQFPPYQNGSQFISDEDLYAATAHLPDQHISLADCMMYGKMTVQPVPSQLSQPAQQQQQQQQQQPQHMMGLPPTKQHDLLLHYQQQQQQQQQQQHFSTAPTSASAVQEPRFSPNAHHNAMLYTPLDMEDGYDDVGAGVDFQLFPSGGQANTSADVGGKEGSQSLFGMPGADLGFSQTSQPDMFGEVNLMLSSQMFQA